MHRPRAFCELPAGLAAVSLRLHGGRHCRPPISRMGNKAGYAEAILDALGLHGGQGAGAYVWAEADPDVRALLRAYPDAAMLTRIAEIIRGWADEEPRELWERLRAERKARGPMAEPDVAGFMVGGWLSYAQDPARGFRATAGGAWPDDPPDPQNIGNRCSTLAAFATVSASNRLINIGGPELTNTGKGGTTFGGAEFATPARDVAGAFEALAGWVVEAGWAFRCGEPESGFNNGVATGAAWNADAATMSRECARLASRWPPVAVLAALPTAADLSALLGTPGDLDGVVVYMDPPYIGTTGYGHDLGRDAVVALARGYDAAGAVVCISEAEPIAALGWHATEITGGRRGQKRTFSKQQGEWLTVNREPAHTVAVQASLFG